MKTQTGYLTRDHERLLNYAVWAKYIAWAALILFAIGAVLGFAGQVSLISYQSSMLGQGSATFEQLLKQNTTYALSLLLGSVRTLFQGVVYFLVLKGISLGLYMVAETDVNYRDRKESVQ